MNDHTTRRMYTKRAPGDINIYAMNEDLTTQELSKEEKEYLYNRAYYLKNKEKNKERDRKRSQKYCIKNKKKISEYYKAYCEKEGMKEKLKVKYKEYYQRNKEKITSKNKKYYYANKRRCYEVGYEYSKKRAATDEMFAVKLKLRNLVSSAFRRIKQSKSTNTQQLLGCSWVEAKLHIESLFTDGMTWENHGTWHIDHIKPVCSFTENELHLMNHITNLRPLWAKDNLCRPDDGSDLIMNPK